MSYPSSMQANLSNFSSYYSIATQSVKEEYNAFESIFKGPRCKKKEEGLFCDGFEVLFQQTFYLKIYGNCHRLWLDKKFFQHEITVTSCSGMKHMIADGNDYKLQ